MERQTKLTPRTKGAQVAPDDSPAIQPSQEAKPPFPASKPSSQTEQLQDPTSSAELEGYNKEVGHLVRTAGRDALKDNIKFYLRLMVPTAIVSGFLFGIFAIMSWFVPHWMCDETSMELSGSSLGISACVYVTDGDYSPYKGSKIFWLIFWSVQFAWLAVFPGMVCKAMFGKCMSHLQEMVVLIAGGINVATTLVTALVFGMALNNWICVLVSSAMSLVVVVVGSTAATRFTGNRLNRWRFIFLFAFAGQVNTFYLMIMPKLITLQSQDALGGMGLTLVRLVVHPAIWTVVLFYFRVFQRHIGQVKDLTQMCFTIWPVLYSSLYGRFLLLQLDSVGSVVILNFMFACFNIADQLNDRGRDQGWLALLYGRRAAEAMQASKFVDEMELINQMAAGMMEVASIVAASALLSFGGIATAIGQPPDNSTIWMNAAIQLVTTLVFNFAEICACGKFHNIEWKKVYPKSIIRFLSYVMVVMLLGGTRLCVELLLLFCPRYYDEYNGFLLEQCDKPSLFQAIALSLKKGRGMPAAVPLDAAYINGTWVATS